MDLESKDLNLHVAFEREIPASKGFDKQGVLLKNPKIIEKISFAALTGNIK